MRKKIVVSMLVIALAAALLGGATFAWFTDSASADLDFTTGTIILGEPVAAALSITEMAPGDTTADWNITIQNAGTLDMFYRLYFTADAENDLDDELIVYINDVAQGTLASLTELTPYFDESTMFIDAGAADVSMTISFELPGTATCQGAAFSGTLVVEATQVKNQTAGSIQWD